MSTDRQRVGVFRLLVSLVWAAIVVAVPAIGVWTASSLAAYGNGPVWLVAAAGLLLFPIGPLLWEARAARRRARRGITKARTLGFGDRLVLRTLALNVVFLAGLLAAFPATAFAALATRGDWFLEGRSGPRVEALRQQLFRAASGLEWLHRRARRNPFEERIDPTARQLPAERPVPAPVVPVEATLPAAPAPGPAEPAAPGGVSWPLPEALHPLVTALASSDETSLESVARVIQAGEREPWRRVKALHDYVADRVAYDVESYRSGVYPPQDAATVFRTRRAVCAGYANLLAAMGAAIGEEIRVVPGDARQEADDLTGRGHAWNAVRVDGRWLLVDATWDAGSTGPEGFTKRYGTRYLFVPPEVIGVTHFPEDPVWQLREPPLSRGDFFRQPVLRAGFFADGLALVSPDRSQVTVGREVSALLKNPRGRSLLAHLVPLAPAAGGEPVDCRVSPGAEARVDCTLPSAGRYRLELFSAATPRERHPLVAAIGVNGSSR